MDPTWDQSRRASSDASREFVRMASLVADRWSTPGLGEWDVRALVGHTSRALLTVETHLGRPATGVEICSAADYVRATRTVAAGSAVSERGCEAGTALGSDPAGAAADIAARVLALVDASSGAELVTTITGGMRLADCLPSRAFELAVHTADLAAALGMAPEVPATAAAQALALVTDLVVGDGWVGLFLLAATGRTGWPAGRTVL